MTSRWWKAPENAFLDRRLQRLPASLFRFWFNLNCVASWAGGRLPATEDIAFLLRSSLAVTERRLAALAAAGLVELQEGKWALAGHDMSDATAPMTGAERTKRWRERRACDDAVTPRDALKREEMGKERESASESDEGFDEFLAAFPRRDEGHAIEPARGAYRKAIAGGAKPADLIAAARAYAAATAGRERKFVASAARWLAEGRWRDSRARPPAVTEPGVWIGEGSPEWRAWAAYWQEMRGVSPPKDSRNGWRFPSRLPPERAAA